MKLESLKEKLAEEIKARRESHTCCARKLWDGYLENPPDPALKLRYNLSLDPRS